VGKKDKIVRFEDMSMLDCIIIGSGPSGLMAANVLEEKGVSYLLLEKNATIGRKLLLTGGTRCNVTNYFGITEFINHLKLKNRRFLYSTLNNFGTKNIVEFFEDKGVQLSLEKEYQYFPKSSKSQDIINALSDQITKENIKLKTNVISVKKTNDGYSVKTEAKEYYTKNVVIATGSKSFPKTGSTGDGVIWGKQFNHKIVPFYPAETHVYSTFVKKNKEYLQGISLKDCEIKINEQKKIYSGGLIFTHYGLSGPLIQNISELIYFDLIKDYVVLKLKLTNYNEDEIRSIFKNKENQNKRVIRILEKLAVKRLAKFILLYLEFKEDKLIASISNQEKQLIIDKLLQFEIKIDEVEKIENSFVNGGGISTNEINPATMESKLHKGLYFIGETLDVHGPIGGFNITIALSTGYSAATNINS